MTTRQAPEIFQLPLDDLDLAGLPARSWQAVVAVDDAFVRVVAVPERGVEPKAYVLGLLQNGFLKDALPVLEFRHYTEVEGRFTDLLPVKEGEGGSGGGGTLH